MRQRVKPSCFVACHPLGECIVVQCHVPFNPLTLALPYTNLPSLIPRPSSAVLKGGLGTRL